MTSLKQAWKKLQFELNARTIFDPSIDVREAMEKEGWTFKLYQDFTCAGMMTPVSYAILIPTSPDGKDAWPISKNHDVYEQYKTARRKAAEQVFGMK